MNFPSGEILKLTIKELLIPSERVAHVQIGNNLEHALLVLTKSGYTAIPVLDPSYKLHGLISTPIIMDSILGLERIEFEQLEKKRVEEVMKKSIPRVKQSDPFPNCLDLLVNHPFLCVETEDGFFAGILPRSTVLNQINTRIKRLKVN
ncbi:cyclic-di-AMP-binding protein CbpB [Neobacillus thermocopriae]|uniref:CBS domain-containing protein n=1 Tax=Neobacillus thermocopriae TaxID=1215031 RepID=A0A6B3TV97_9BACI|nr:cyclic-di-AMP-binding protein CbpB [Neobacillus thermocopriae]MED3623350.1 CBS domain-containing protein [Neobacillus thermocopriae]MED3715634.1 CBS domain-containing protein [Neobacillus thermocopriae]NEX80306.1 CBS domain-containing protein [Neobacillus thermocopriae]